MVSPSGESKLRIQRWRQGQRRYCLQTAVNIHAFKNSSCLFCSLFTIIFSWSLTKWWWLLTKDSLKLEELNLIDHRCLNRPKKKRHISWWNIVTVWSYRGLSENVFPYSFGINLRRYKSVDVICFCFFHYSFKSVFLKLYL